MEPMNRNYAGAAAVARLTAPLGGTDSDQTLSLSTVSGWTFPDGALFAVSVNRGKPTEEKILCWKVTKNADDTGSIAVYVVPSGEPDQGKVLRGWDDTTIQSHPLDATVEHVWTATDAREVHDMLMAHKQALLDVNARFNGTWRSLLPVATP
jgi:hypothetical protein